MQQEAKLPSLKVGVGWTPVEVVSDVDVILTFRGYAPVLQVRATKTGLEYTLYITPKSLSEALEPLRERNGGKFKGLKFEIRKASEEKFANYELRVH